MTEQPTDLRALWDSLTLDEREVVAFDWPEEDDRPHEAWKRIVSLGLRDEATGDLTPLGERVREEWEKVWRPLAQARNLPKRRGGKTS